MSDMGGKHPGTSLPGHDRLSVELTAPLLVTHAGRDGCVHHPGRRESRCRGTYALGSSSGRTEARWSADLCCGPGTAMVTGPTSEGCMTARLFSWKRRTTLIAALASVAVALPALAVGASAVGRVPSGVGVIPAAQAPSHFAAVTSKRVGARDSMTPATSAAAVKYQQALMQAEMLEFTTRSAQTRDMRGIEASLYRGDYFTPKTEDLRACIVKRESEGRYDVRGGGGNRYFGAYQMNDELADGATWMMLDEHKDILGADEARALMEELRATPVTKWPRYWQDAAFYTIYNWEGPASGAAHWAGGRWSC